MQTFTRDSELQTMAVRRAVAIGIFDGVHRGHQALLSRAVALARQEGLQSLALTFDPHPASVLNAALAPKLIEPLAVRLQRLEALGLDAVCVQPFDLEFAKTEAEAFVQQCLVRNLGARHVVIGAGFTFGRKQQGHVALLEAMGREFGFAVHPIDHVRADGIEVSSTKIREFVHTGQVLGAALLLGRPFELVGTVEKGAQRGATLGFPTANVRPDNDLWPMPGVYAAYAMIDAESAARRAVVNIGVAPTFGGAGGLRVEAHLLHFAGPSLYGHRLRVQLVERLRDEQRFADVNALKEQIHRDAATAAAMLADRPPASSS